MHNTRIAFDLGGVILLREALQNHLIQESDISVKLAVQKFGADNVFIISKAKDKYQQRNLDLLHSVNFFQNTGLRAENIYFVDEYEDKAVKMKALGITYILDDAIKIAKDCAAKGLKPILFGDHDEFLENNKELNIINAKTWKSFRKLL